MDIRDLLDKLTGSPGWHRDHLKAWESAATMGVDGISQLQSLLKAAISDVYQAAHLPGPEWVAGGNKDDSYLVATIPKTALQLWLYPDGAGVSTATRFGRSSAVRIYEEWDFKTPGELVDSVASDLTEILKRAQSV